jgi:hypothetical protein
VVAQSVGDWLRELCSSGGSMGATPESWGSSDGLSLCQEKEVKAGGSSRFMDHEACFKL